MSVEALQKVALVNVDLSTWSGYKRTSDEELRKLGIIIPDDSPLTKGGKKIYPTETLNEFANIRKEITRKMSKVGIRALGGSAYAIPESKVDEVGIFLDDVKSRVESEIRIFDSTYDVRIRDYLASIQDPITNQIISKSVLPKSDAVAKFGVRWQVFKIVPASNTEESSKDLVSSMSGTLLNEIAESAQKIFADSFHGKPKVTQKSIGQIRNLRDKLEGLSFLDEDNIKYIVQSIDESLAKLPTVGWLEGNDYNAVVAILIRMKDPQFMLEHAQKVREGMSNLQAAASSAGISESIVIADAISNPVASVESTQQPVVDLFSSENTKDEPAMEPVIVNAEVQKPAESESPEINEEVVIADQPKSETEETENPLLPEPVNAEPAEQIFIPDVKVEVVVSESESNLEESVQTVPLHEMESNPFDDSAFF